MKYQFFATSDVGMIREQNEDCLGFDSDTGMALLADGLGGYNSGEIASAVAVSYAFENLVPWLRARQDEVTSQDILQEMSQHLQQVNATIWHMATTQAAHEGMGTTWIMGIFHDSVLCLGHVGDSRAYRWRDGRLQQLTRDDTVVQDMLDLGEITPLDASKSSARSVLTRALGVGARIEGTWSEYEVVRGDIYLLCSDGLTDMVGQEQIGTLLCGADSLSLKAHALVEAANDNGGYDNISVLLVHAQ